MMGRVSLGNDADNVSR